MQIAFVMIIANFLKGIAINNYWFAMHSYVPATYDWPFVYVVHNIFLLVFAETGITGFIAIILLFAMPVMRMFRLYRGRGKLCVYALWLATCLFTMGMMNLVDLSWSAPIVNSFYFLLLALVAVILNLNGTVSAQSGALR